MFQSSQIDSPSARHLRRSQHEKWKVLIRVENSQYPLAGQKNTMKQITQINFSGHFIVNALFMNKRFALNDMFQRNASKFAIFYV